ncbi:MAG: 5'-deoxyadenosine deaminase [Bacteroidota bacterium]|nr:5'-deoxyadenosine deaminase [Bacteroidota bacterium]
MSILLKNTTVVTVNSKSEILYNASVLIDNNRIAAIFPSINELTAQATEIINAEGYVIIPGFVQTHVHLCQTLFRGLADDLLLLDWLKIKIFPLEEAHDERSIYTSSLVGIAELIRSGTTTILDMGSIHHEEEIIRAIGETGLRSSVGKAMMDVNDIYPPFKESKSESLRSTREQAEKWHNTFDGRIRYAVAPRFVLSCTDSLMQEVFEMASGFPGMLFHTHASENKSEIQKVRERCGRDNIEHLHHLGLLSDRTVLAHCIHLNENEFSMLKSTGTHVAHCPSSNLKLGSGIANIPQMLAAGINVSLGADGAPCNNTLNMFQEMRLASLIQKPFHGPTVMDSKTVFELATIGGARALRLENEIGSIEKGKKADIVLLNLNYLHNPLNSLDNIYSAIVYSASPENIDSVMINGKWVFRHREFIGLDHENILSDARKELKHLLLRYKQ